MYRGGTYSHRCKSWQAVEASPGRVSRRFTSLSHPLAYLLQALGTMDDESEHKQEMEVDQGKSVNVQFVTKIADEALHLPDKPFVVSALLNRRGLSEIVNQLLKLNPPRAFDFLANDIFLRSTIEEHLKAREGEAERVRISFTGCKSSFVLQEAVIKLEYLEAQKPPQPADTLEHDDWVSAISARLPGYVVHFTLAAYRLILFFLLFFSWILTGCYDNKVRLWKADRSGQPIVRFLRSLRCTS